MAWIAVALASAAVSGGLTIIDKQTLSKYMPSMGSFGLVLAVIQASWSLIALVFHPLSGDVALSYYAITLLSGCFWGLALIVYYFVLIKEEASRVSPVFHTYPAIVAVLGVTLLSESLSSLQWLAVMVTIAGAMLISARKSAGRAFSINRKSFAILMLASTLAAFGQLTSKYALDNVAFWDVFIVRNLGIALPFFIYLSKDSIKGFYQSLKTPAGFLYIIGGELVWGGLTVLIALVAVNMGPISIISAILGTRPVFVFLYTSVLSTNKLHAMDEPITRDVLFSKGIAIAMVVAGVAALSLL